MRACVVCVCLVVAGQPHQRKRNRQAQPSHRSEIGPSSERGYMAVAGWMTLVEGSKARLRTGRKADDCSEQTRRSHTHDPTFARPTLLNWIELNANLHVLCIESSLFFSSCVQYTVVNHPTLKRYRLTVFPHRVEVQLNCSRPVFFR